MKPIAMLRAVQRFLEVRFVHGWSLRFAPDDGIENICHRDRVS